MPSRHPLLHYAGSSETFIKWSCKKLELKSASFRWTPSSQDPDMHRGGVLALWAASCVDMPPSPTQLPGGSWLTTDPPCHISGPHCRTDRDTLAHPPAHTQATQLCWGIWNRDPYVWKHQGTEMIPQQHLLMLLCLLHLLILLLFSTKIRVSCPPVAGVSIGGSFW